jgi:purine-binding chemotaxis protein CheW
MPAIGAIDKVARIAANGERWEPASSIDKTGEQRMGSRASSSGTPGVTPRKTKAGKYLTFVLAGEEYGLGILSVREINGLMDITAAPQLPPYVKGFVNLRGQMIPAVDLRLKLGMEEISYTPETCIIVVELKRRLMGIIVDQVSEVLDISAAQIEDAPSFGTMVNANVVLGIGKAKGSAKTLLALDKLFSDEELASVIAAV